MWVEESHMNSDEGYGIYEDRWELEGSVLKDFTDGEIFRWMQKEHGRCIGKVMVDYLHADSKYGPYAIGWVFIKKDRYEDTGEPYIHETWISLLDSYQEKTIKEYRKVA